MNLSVATVRDPEFINITSVSPLIQKCQIKVLYLGKDRNKYDISKEAAIRIAQTIPGTPIVGYYCESKQDFDDHQQLVIDEQGVRFKSLTKPYGFVAPDAKVWFQEFQDTDMYGNTVNREYLVTEGYLWTEQYKECQRVLENGNPQSMELKNDSLKGYWSEANNKGVKFFILNDAVVSKLCILGNDIEPCFEGASVTSFSLDKEFSKSLYTMFKEIDTFTLNNKEGESSMDNMQNNETPVNELENSTNFACNPEQDDKKKKEDDKEFACGNASAEEDKKKKDEEFACGGSEDDKKKKDENFACDPKKEDDKEDPKKEEDDEKDKKFALLQEQFNNLQTEFSTLQEKFSALESENATLTQFKQNVENNEKDNMIASFSMLSDEDKKDVIENKTNYSLNEIKSKLACICFDKKVNFSLDNEDNQEQKDVNSAVTFSLDNVTDSAPAWIKAIRAINNK